MIGFRSFFAPLLSLSVFAACAGIIWLAHVEAGKMTSDRQPPLVKASTIPLKRSPEDPGGRAVADLGGVRDLMRDQPAEAEERLLPRPEQPRTPADETGLAEGREADVDAHAALEALVQEMQDGSAPGEDVGVGGPSETTPTNGASTGDATIETVSLAPVTPEALSPVENTAASSDDNQPVEIETAAVSPVFETSPDGRYRVQLAAVREEADAQRAWEVFRQQLGPFITGLKPFFERAETSNGIFYRVQVGPFAATEEASRLCVELQKQDASCFVVTR